MNKLLNLNFWSEYSLIEWKAVKISVALFWFSLVTGSEIEPNGLPYPSGLFSFFGTPAFPSKYTVLLCSIFAAVLIVLYIAEKWMIATTFLMFLLSLVLFTMEESCGIQNRKGLVTMIFFAQSIAYLRNNHHLNEERIQFPIQIIAAGYFLAGLSKIKDSGLHWVLDGPQISLQVMKSYSFSYFDTGNITELNKGINYSEFILHHTTILGVILSTSLVFELFAWLAVKNKLWAFIAGILLTAMHIGIFFSMDILIRGVFYPMVVFFVNPLYLVFVFTKSLWFRIK